MDEVAAVLELWHLAEAMPSVTDDPETLQSLVERGDEALLVAETDGRLVGSIIAAWDGWRGNMYRLAILPEYRRRGIASALIREGERRLAQKGAVRVSALVLRQHGDAVGLWMGAGYSADERVRRFVTFIPPVT